MRRKTTTSGFAAHAALTDPYPAPVNRKQAGAGDTRSGRSVTSSGEWYHHHRLPKWCEVSDHSHLTSTFLLGPHTTNLQRLKTLVGAEQSSTEERLWHAREWHRGMKPCGCVGVCEDSSAAGPRPAHRRHTVGEGQREESQHPQKWCVNVLQFTRGWGAERRRMAWILERIESFMGDGCSNRSARRC